ncbi:MAG: efflux RND transporter periplasmic adaptor subunit [Bacteroidales bacterium]|nr:efflux RND transporter periplasmic adaptor subunit [Bacteroidales bacterium]
MKRISLSIVLAFAVAAISFQSCSSGKKNDAKKTKTEVVAENVRVITLEPRNIGRVLEFSANTTAWEEVNLVPVSPGRIEKIYVEVGNHVSSGQTLVQMDQTSLRQATLNIDNQANDFKRYETLHETGAISQQTYDQTKTQLDVQKNNLAYLQKNTRITAPFSGVITAKNYENGELYTGAQAIVTIAQLNSLKAFINIPESFFPMVKKGMKAAVKSDIYKGQSFAATVTNIAPTLNASAHTFEVELKIPNGKQLLAPGMFVRATLEMGDTKVMVVPYQAVLKLQGSNERYVFLEKNGVAERITVTLGGRFDDQVELISEKITKGDHLVIAGQAKLKNGSKLNVVK